MVNGTTTPTKPYSVLSKKIGTQNICQHGVTIKTEHRIVAVQKWLTLLTRYSLPSRQKFATKCCSMNSRMSSADSKSNIIWSRISSYSAPFAFARDKKSSTSLSSAETTQGFVTLATNRCLFASIQHHACRACRVIDMKFWKHAWNGQHY